MVNVFAYNNTQSVVTVANSRVYYVDKQGIEIVDVYDSINNKYRAFKYIYNDTTFYYVADKIQSKWTNNLESIGYSLTRHIILPDVTNTGFLLSNGNTTSGTVATVTNNSAADMTVNSGSTAALWYVYGSIWYVSNDDKSLYDVGYYIRHSDSTHYSTINKFSVNNPSIGSTFSITNISEENLPISYISLYKCSDATAETITVYDQSNEPYKAFLYNAEGTNYYYVLDGYNADWTDNLQSIGYDLVKHLILPVVEAPFKYSVSTYAYSVSNTQLAPNESSMVYWHNGSLGHYAQIEYNSSLTYSLSSSAIYNGSSYTNTDPTELAFVQHGYYVYIKNVSDNAVQACVAYMYTCSDVLSTTVITVEDSSNVRYNSFKYTFEGSDYYYVLDGEQSEWVDSLTSIGYHIPIEGGDYQSEDFNVTDGMPEVMSFTATQSPSVVQNGISIDTNLEYNQSYLYAVQTVDDNNVVSYSGWQAVDFPLVSTSGDFGTYNQLRDGGNRGAQYANGMVSNEWLFIGDTDTHPVYDESKSYAILKATDNWYNNEDVDPPIFGVVNDTTGFAIKNMTNKDSYGNIFRVAVCHSNKVTVVIVEDTSSNIFNAFRYYINETYYYYVLDGTRNEWVADLSAIGYHLPQTLTGYVSSDKSYQTVNYNNSRTVYSSNGSQIPAYSNKRYFLVSFREWSRGKVENIPTLIGIKTGWNSIDFGFIRFSSDSYYVYSIEYFYR